MGRTCQYRNEMTQITDLKENRQVYRASHREFKNKTFYTIQYVINTRMLFKKWKPECNGGATERQ